jgi:flagellar hook-associated protein 2
VVSTINSDNLGVKARVVTDATGSRLAIVSNNSGSASNFSVSAPTGGSLSFTQAVNGANASLTVDGLSISSASNTVTGAIPGVTLNLLNAAPGTNVSLTIAPNTSQVSTAINQFVSDYNTLITAVNAQFSDTSGSGEGVLANDPVVRNLQSDLQNALDYLYTPASGSTTVSSLASLGISVGNDGTLTVDSSTLNSALQNNFSDVQTFFQGTAFNGFANSLDQQLTGFTSPADGAFTVDLQNINFQNNYITPLKTQLNAEYSQAEILLQQLPEEMQQINTELGENNKSSS